LRANASKAVTHARRTSSASEAFLSHIQHQG
jgi:hypothetical protein